MLKKIVRCSLLAATIGLALNATSAMALESKIGDAEMFSSTTSAGVINIDFSGGYNGGSTGVNFADSFSFSLPKTSDLSGFLGPLNLRFAGFSAQNISNLTLSLFKTGTNTPIGSGNSFTVLTQPSGNYSGVITGTILAGKNGGYYGNVTASVSPVPESETYLMMLTGLAVLGVAATRSSKGTKRPTGLAA
jgi:hypothetical protein